MFEGLYKMMASIEIKMFNKTKKGFKTKMIKQVYKTEYIRKNISICK